MVFFFVNHYLLGDLAKKVCDAHDFFFVKY